MSLSYEEEAEAERIAEKRIDEEHPFQAGLAILQAAAILRGGFDRETAVNDAIKMYEMIKKEGWGF